jgi:hypothetical protein
VDVRDSGHESHNEEVKAVIAYALVVVGIPQVIGMTAGLPFARLGRTYRTSALIVDPFNGLGGIAVAVVIFRLFGLEPTWVVPVILAAWTAVCFLPKEQFLMWFCYMAGVVGGWMIYRGFVAGPA